MKKLNEIYGFRDFDNPELKYKCEKLADYIITSSYKKNVKKFRLYTSTYGKPTELTTFRDKDSYNELFGFSYRLDLDWIDSINVFLFNTSNPRSAMVVDNTVMYQQQPNGSQKIVKQDFCFFNVDDNSVMIPMMRTKDKINYGSILFNINQNDMYNKKELVYVIMHEIGHLYDVYSWNMDTSFINRDLVNNKTNKEVVRRFIDSTDPYAFDSNYNIARILNDMNTSLNKKIQIIKSGVLNTELIDIIMLLNVYRLNISELYQHIKNFVYELSLHSSDELKNVDAMTTNKENGLCELSETYKAYHSTAVLFGLLVKYTPIRIKIKFVEDVLLYRYEADYDVETDKEGMPYSFYNAYNKSFAINGRYNENTFDEFFNWHRKRINKLFLRNCSSIFINAKQNLKDVYGVMFEFFDRMNSLLKNNSNEYSYLVKLL